MWYGGCAHYNRFLNSPSLFPTSFAIFVIIVIESYETYYVSNTSWLCIFCFGVIANKFCIIDALWIRWEIDKSKIHGTPVYSIQLFTRETFCISGGKIRRCTKNKPFFFLWSLLLLLPFFSRYLIADEHSIYVDGSTASKFWKRFFKNSTVKYFYRCNVCFRCARFPLF